MRSGRAGTLIWVNRRHRQSGNRFLYILVKSRTELAMALSLNLNVVAEGVETIAQLDALRALGCDEDTSDAERR